jgi:hypothetical protein
MNYTAKQIDRMSIDQLDSLAQILTDQERNKWVGSGYDGATYIKIIKNKGYEKYLFSKPHYWL